MRLWYRCSRSLYRLYFWTYHRGRVIGADRVPATGGCIFAANHVSFLDPPLLGAALEREICFLARDTLFRHPVANWLLRSWNSIPINRERGDLSALRTVLRLLNDGEGVLMFPEGTRSRDGQLQEGQAGIGMIVARAAVPVVPMRIFGSDKALPRGKSLPQPAQITIVIGEPFTYPLPADYNQLRGRDLKALYWAISQEIMRRIANLQRPTASR